MYLHYRPWANFKLMKTSKHIFYDISAKNGYTLGHQNMRLYFMQKRSLNVTQKALTDLLIDLVNLIKTMQ